MQILLNKVLLQEFQVDSNKLFTSIEQRRIFTLYCKNVNLNFDLGIRKTVLSRKCTVYSSAPQSRNAVYMWKYKNTVDTSIKHQISCQSTSMPKGYILHVQMFDIVDTPFGYGRALIIC